MCENSKRRPALQLQIFFDDVLMFTQFTEKKHN